MFQGASRLSSFGLNIPFSVTMPAIKLACFISLEKIFKKVLKKYLTIRIPLWYRHPNKRNVKVVEEKCNHLLSGQTAEKYG